MFVFIRAETLKVQEVRLVVDLVKLQRHFGVTSIHRVLAAHSNVKRIHHLPFLRKTDKRRIQQTIPEMFILRQITHKVQRFHGSVNLVHDVVGLTLRSDAWRSREKKGSQMNRGEATHSWKNTQTKILEACLYYPSAIWRVLSAFYWVQCVRRHWLPARGTQLHVIRKTI